MPTSRTFQVEVRTGQRTKLEVNVYSRTVNGHDKMLINADGKGALTVDEIVEVISKSVRGGLISEIKEKSPSATDNTSSPKLPSEKLIHIIAMAIINYTAESMGVSPSIRQARNDKCDLFAIAKIKELLGKIGR